MAIIHNLESAKIIPFPLQRRLAPARHADTGAKVMNEAEQPRVTYDNWYHDEAIREERPRKQ